MKLELKRLYSIDLPNGPPEMPPEPTDCWVVVQAEIGPEDEDGADVFTFYVCSHRRLGRLLNQQEAFWGRYLLLVKEFDWQGVEKAILTLLEEVESSSWVTAVTQLKKYGLWEFEEYKDGNEPEV